MDKIEKIKIPKYWKYTESWCQKALGAPDTCFDEDSKYFLDKICKAKEADLMTEVMDEWVKEYKEGNMEIPF